MRPLGCTHDVEALLSDAVLSEIAAKHQSEGRVPLRTTLWLGQRNVAFGFSRQPIEKCVHVVVGLGASAGAAPGEASALAVEFLAWEFDALTWQERYKPCPDCATEGCPSCDRLGWERGFWCDAVIGAPGSLLHHVESPAWSAWRDGMRSGWTWLEDALRDPRRR